MSPCTHGVVEIETAANCDGLCPLCLQAALAAARAEVDALREPAPSVVCQKCGRLGGKVVSFEHDGISESRWVCPLCLDDIEAERDEAVQRADLIQSAADCYHDDAIKLNARIALLEGVLRTDPEILAVKAWNAERQPALLPFHKIPKIDQDGMIEDVARAMRYLRDRAALDGGRE